VSLQQRGQRQPAPFGRRRLRVTRNEPIGAYRLLWAIDESSDLSPAPVAGQFAMIAAAERWGAGVDERPYLPRAFSIARVSEAGEWGFLIEDVGPGTARLCELEAEDGLWALGPLGRGFEPAPAHARTILVGGGIGIAPLMILQDALAATPRSGRMLTLLGFRGAEHAKAAALLHDPVVATDDGAVGHEGLVTELLESALKERQPSVVRACGPPAMLEAVRAICARGGVDAQLALEAGMACGYGACYGCAVRCGDGSYLRVCLDGPVIDAAMLEQVR
jgi:dihydroorotate dehydrogenase electron transfer subunit